MLTSQRQDLYKGRFYISGLFFWFHFPWVLFQTVETHSASETESEFVHSMLLVTLHEEPSHLQHSTISPSLVTIPLKQNDVKEKPENAAASLLHYPVQDPNSSLTRGT